MKIAHLSDLHLLDLAGAVPFRLFNKRFTGYMNLRLRRGAIHKPFAVRAAVKAIRDLEVDHVVVTGDLSNLSLEAEFALALKLLDDLGLPSSRVSLVPGNHDVYTRGAHRSSRFARTFAPFIASDLPDLAVEGSAFPYVKLRGPVAIVGLSTALPRLPFVASGELGVAQLKALENILEHPEVRSRTPVVLQHHPIVNPKGRLHVALEGLADATEELQILRRLPRGLVLHGHLHRRIQRTMPTPLGEIHSVGTTSASLIDPRPDRMAGFNLYEIADGGALVSLTAHRLDLADQSFHEVELPSA